MQGTTDVRHHLWKDISAQLVLKVGEKKLGTKKRLFSVQNQSFTRCKKVRQRAALVAEGIENGAFSFGHRILLSALSWGLTPQAR